MLDAGHCIAIQCAAKTRHGAGAQAGRAGPARSAGRARGAGHEALGARAGHKRATWAHLGTQAGPAMHLVHLTQFLTQFLDSVLFLSHFLDTVHEAGS